MEQGIGSHHRQHMVVVGASGKMGRGISLLLLQQLALEVARHGCKDQGEPLRLTLIDTNATDRLPLKHYLRNQLQKYAEKNINELRALYRNRADLVDNEEMIDAFMEEAMDRVFFGSLLEECQGAQLVFEAIVEDVDIKADVFAAIDRVAGPECYYFTNTSSIPIHILEKKSGLQGRLIGFHFYNPPAVQRLLELILPRGITLPFKTLAVDIAKQLKKNVVFSEDIAGFIGNGYFIREIQFACRQVHALAKHMPLIDAIMIVNKVTQEFLLRPMGIFQLIDYVGIDVCQRIAKIMTTYLSHPFGNELIDAMALEGRVGGQHGDGSQKDGFFHYAKGVPVSIYDAQSKGYAACDDAYCHRLNGWLDGKQPLGYSWKMLNSDPKREEKIHDYFQCLRKEKGRGAQLALTFAQEVHRIALALVADGVAHSLQDVDTVLINGFFHLYGVCSYDNEGIAKKGVCGSRI